MKKKSILILILAILATFILGAVLYLVFYHPSDWTFSDNKSAWTSCVGFVEQMYGLPANAAESYHPGIVQEAGGGSNVFHVTLYYPASKRTMDCFVSYDKATRTWHLVSALNHSDLQP